MVGCSAYGCQNKNGPHMHLFRFPRDAESRKIWENKVRRANWSANENHRLCQAHFLDDQFETNHADGLKKLKSTAVPTIFCHRPRPRYRKAPVKRTSDVMDSTTEVTMEARERRISFRGRIVGCHEAGQSIRTIAKNLGISTRTVLRWIRRSEDTDWYGNLPRGRPPRCTTPAQRRDILQAAEADPQTNAVAIRESLHLDVSERTVRRVLHEAGVHHRTPANKEFLTDQHREGRLLFAQQYVDKPEEFWKRVIWTDEKTFSSSCHGKRQCWRRNDTRDSPENVNIWGWVSWHGMGDMQQIEGRFSAEKYIDILNNFFLPSFTASNHPFPPGPVYFVQGRCSVHQARVVQEWFQQHPNIQLLPWPSKGADCNPIENIWGSMVTSWEPERERTPQELLDHIRQVWEIFRGKPDHVRRHTGNIQQRLQAVIEKGGGWTGY